MNATFRRAGGALLVMALAAGCAQSGSSQPSVTGLSSVEPTTDPSPTSVAGASLAPSALPFGCPSDFDGELNAVIAMQHIQDQFGSALALVGLESYGAKYTRTHDGDQVSWLYGWKQDAPPATAALGETLDLSLVGDGARVDGVVARYFRRDDLQANPDGSAPKPVATRDGTVNSDGSATLRLPTTRAAYVTELTVAFETSCFTASGVAYISLDVQ